MMSERISGKEIPKKVLKQSVFQQIVTLGIAYKPVRGGISAVENSYATFYKPFNFIRTTVANGGVVKKLLVLSWAWGRFLACMLNPKIKIVHVHSASGKSFWRKSLFIRAAKGMGRKVVFHCHGGGFRDFTAKHQAGVVNILRKADVIIALSDVWQAFFVQEIHHPHVVTIANPVERAYEDHSIRNEQLCTFLFLGSINKNKGVYDLLETIALQQDQLRGRARFILGGLGELDKAQENVSQYGITDLVTFAGWVDGLKKIEYLNQADVFLLPSYYEGVPICILEAASYHLPVISTQVGGIAEVVKHDVNGFLLNPGDKVALGDAIKYMVENPQARLLMGQRSADFIHAHSIDRVEESLTKLYRELLDENVI